jgi:hypothetical protein
MNCGNKPFAQISGADFEFPFTEGKPIEGYEIPVNKETGETFPDCCNYHKGIFKRAKEWFEKFPGCCEPHKKLLKVAWFNKDNYKDAPLKIVQQLSFTAFHIEKQIGTSDWYKDITDYIHYSISSFGQLPTGYGSAVGLPIYLAYLKSWVQETKAIFPQEKRKRLIEYIEGYEKPISESNKTDLNILYSTYQKWLKVFPFGVSYFSELKEYFSKKMPFISGQPEYNKYTGTHSVNVQTQSGLIEALTNTTKALLKKIDSVELVEKNLIADKDKHRLELLNANHRLKQSSLLNDFSKGEMKYIKVLKKWLSNEKEYFTEVSPLIKNSNTIFKKEPPQTLFDIWLPDSKGSKEQYTKFIEHLQKDYRITGTPFVTDVNGKKYWNKTPQKGWQQYMAAFIHTCIHNRWIADQYSAPTFVKILNNTFNAEPDPKWFKSISTTPPNPDYLKPFKGLPVNI